MADNIPQLAWMKDAEGWTYWYNQRWYDYTGTVFKDMEGWGWQRVHHPEHIERVTASLKHALATGEKWEEIFPLRGRDGEFRWFLTRAKPLRDASGKIVRWFGTNTDITEQRRLEESLRKSQERLELAMHGTSDGIWDWNVTTGEVFHSPRWIEMLGYTPEEWKSTYENWLLHIHPGDIARTEETVRGYLIGDMSEYQNIFRMRHKDGSWRWMLSRAKAIRDENGKPLRMVGTHTDISEQKRLQDMQKRFLETGADLLLIGKHDGYFEWVSPSWTALLGWTEEELKGQPWLNFVHPDDRKATIAAADALKRGEEVIAFVSRYRHKDGSYRSIEWRVRTYPDEQRVYGTGKDVTERQNAEQALAKQLALTNAITNNAAVSLFIMDEKQRCVFMNPAAEELTGYTTAEVQSRPLHYYVHHTKPDGSPYPLEECPIDRAFPERNQMRGEELFVHKDGHFYPVAFTASPIRDGNGITGTIIEVQDITTRKRAEAELREAKERAEEASRAKSSFLANMSHEIRTPMNAVVGLSAILSMRKDLPPQVVEMVSTLKLSAESLMRLINDLLDIAKIETNKLELELLPLRLSDIMGEAVSIAMVSAKEKGIALITENSPVALAEYRGDALRIRQILNNLVGNAVKFTDSGEVRISLHITPCTEPGMDYVHITVRDTGIGIAADKLENIFEKFMQADASTTRRFGGTGLGLAISKNLAEIMGGGITVESEPGKGSVFTLHIPLERQEKAKFPMQPFKPTIATLPVQVMPSLEERPCVLLVEDYAANVLVAQSMLESMGYQSELAEDGQQALARIASGRDSYCAVLMDVQMPGLDGLEVTRRVREEERARRLTRLPVIAMTAFALKEDRQRCLDAGMDAYISKPFKYEELETILRKYQHTESHSACEAVEA